MLRLSIELAILRMELSGKGSCQESLCTAKALQRRCKGGKLASGITE